MGNIAFKEWAIVCRALGEGRQLFVARKGGIAEEEGEFTVTADRFFLFPTYLHQASDLLKPSIHLEYRLVAEQEPKDGKLHLENFAVITDKITVAREEIIPKISDQHLWTDKVLKNRFVWGTHSGLTLLVLRVYRLPQEVVIPMKKDYGGCRSWVTLDREISVTGATPVLNDEEFRLKREALFKLL